MRVKFLQPGKYGVFVAQGTQHGGPRAAGWKQSARWFEAGETCEYPGQGQWYAQSLIDRGLAVGLVNQEAES